MAFKDYTTPRPTKWVTIGGINKQGTKNPSNIEGYYLGASTGPNKFEPGKVKTDFMLQTVEGIVAVNGNANLVKQISESEGNLAKDGLRAVGAKLNIKFDRMERSSKGTSFKVFTVTFDTDDTLDLATVQTIAQDSYEDEEENENEEAGNNYADNNYGAAAKVAASSTSDRKAQVEALLKGSSRKRA